MRSRLNDLLEEETNIIKNLKVYVLASDYVVHGVFATRELAHEKIKELTKGRLFNSVFRVVGLPITYKL
jgi:hypothetical protein